ncbi:hypothetical protein HCAG_07265 [Histoplasma mississippiense (nom. inval.)]|uniref:hypothetical protein n=1 Tax=Ajellomyces capsulatus (strain NAm1 / WU24) TaxID=2059318 RepID=UPI000157CFD0|nr:hypothetical protein HCAG_07265 [Histoplasma mississippiense (nom. inval.)]EDN10804.1 hypothetical protein HCAG_07265 [Histoplasma mississippiense (nom. inval.)]
MATQAPPPPASPSPPPSPPVTEGISTSSPRLPSGGVTGTGTISTSPPVHPPAPIPPPVPVETHPNRTGLKPPPPRRVLTDPNRLAPEDAYYAHSPPRFRSVVTNNHAAHLRLPAAVAALRPPPAVPGAEPRRAKEARRRFGSRRRRPKGAWKKLLWVKQSSSISGSSTRSVKATNDDRNQKENQIPSNDLRLSTSNLDCQQLRRHSTGLSTLSAHSHSASACSLHSGNSPQSPNSPMSPFTPINLNNGSLHFPNHCHYPQHSTNNGSTLSPRNRQRLETAKSALLIFCALLGLSPILKSLTKSTTSDSIWAMSCWLMVINIFFFDYSSNSGGSGTGGSAESGATAAKFPSSLSTNAAVMASTGLASRLKSTTHVFSLTLFSIEVFGLFPVFRRHLRAISWRGHVLLTVSLVIIASAAVGITLREVQKCGGWPLGPGQTSSEKALGLRHIG